jgi:hypothetical protein
MSNLQPPFDKFRLEKHAGEYKDFQLQINNPYPLRGVTYPVDYGDIPDYVGEDGADLDIFVGNGILNGFIIVRRPDIDDGEHKFYINVNEEEESAILKEFSPVLQQNGRFETFNDLLAAIKPFQKQV